jgi:hypothetical protein
MFLVPLCYAQPGNRANEQEKPDRTRYVICLYRFRRGISSSFSSTPRSSFGVSLLSSMVALLRPGRFEVQIEIPPPRTVAQRVSILKVHTKHMFVAGRLQVSDPPAGRYSSFVTYLASIIIHPP